MKELRTPQKQHSPSSALTNRRSKDHQPKKQNKFAKKNLNAVFTTGDGDDDSPSIFDESSDVSKVITISEAKSHEDLFESFAFPEIFTPCSRESVVTTDEQISDSKATSPVEVEITLRCLKEAQSQLLNSLDVDTSSKKLLDALIKIVIDGIHPLPDDRDRLAELVSSKARVTRWFFLLWILIVSTVMFFSSGNHGSYIGPLPT